MEVSFMYLIIGIIFIAVGIFSIKEPEMIYELLESWKSYAIGEPSKYYIVTTRIGGAIVIVVGISSIIVFIMQLLGVV
jgi:hypothetical protein